MKDVALIVLTGLLAMFIFLTGWFAIAAQDDEPKAAPFVKVSRNSSQDRVEKFFNYRTKARVVFNQYYWKGKTGEPTEDEIFAYYNATKPAQKTAIRQALAKQGYKRYLRTCSQLDAKDSSWSMGYCVNSPAKIQDVQG